MVGTLLESGFDVSIKAKDSEEARRLKTFFFF